ncbi:MAG: MBL fold metallo-hydrolase [Clostridiales Family XIII bacterium]|jgi:glyoxylase-like metal-dependent hydrolase (beta-lactamase superfamily II)|nr:MBL fold metallo-hydrolase [Clostridiales Family XIII bacterium]
MRVRIYETIAQLTLLPHLFPVNCYLVDDDDGGFTLVDTGLPIAVGGILRAADDLGKPVRRIVLTHAHQDHAGGLDRLKAALPDALVYASARTQRLLGGDFSLAAGEPTTPIRGRFPSVRARADVLIEDGDLVDSLCAVACPGHIPGQLCFYDPRCGALLTGDAAQTRGRFAVAGDSVRSFPWVAMATWDPALAARSFRRMQESLPPVRYWMPGHGDVLETCGLPTGKDGRER